MTDTWEMWIYDYFKSEFPWLVRQKVGLLKSIDINRASKKQFQELLPGVSERVIDRMLRERERQPYRDLADLQERNMLNPSVLEELLEHAAFFS